MLKTQPVMDLFHRAEAAVVERIRRDGESAPPKLRPLFHHIQATFYDPALDLAREKILVLRPGEHGAAAAQLLWDVVRGETPGRQWTRGLVPR